MQSSWHTNLSQKHLHTDNLLLSNSKLNKNKTVTKASHGPDEYGRGGISNACRMTTESLLSCRLLMYPERKCLRLLRT